MLIFIFLKEIGNNESKNGELQGTFMIKKKESKNQKIKKVWKKMKTGFKSDLREI